MPQQYADVIGGGDCIQVLEPHSGDFTNTITSVQKDNVLVEAPGKEGLKIATPEITAKCRIRRLTPLECWRLMGFEDDDFYRAQAAMNENLYGGKDRSGTQLYKQAGNSIVVDVLLHIFENLYDAMPYLFEDIKVGSFFSGIGAFEKALTLLGEPRAEQTGDTRPDQLEQIGYINDYNGDANRIYDCSVARALKAEAGGGGAKTGWYRFPQ